ncbi:hypothetical protein PUN28_011239 [Cardiocondyla obscurior]|uniref:Odorant receptor n=1 Tax=Cardiocondyla obscurior TaxID=286306 RepID=A0AAW2FQX4_9HYME
MLNFDKSNVERSQRVIKNRRNKMESNTVILKHTLMLMMVAGCWQPLSWISSFKNILYNAYVLLLMLLLYAFAISQIMAIIVNTANPEEFTGVLYMMMAVFVGIFKISSMWISRKNIANIVNTLTERPFLPMIDDEVKIHRTFEKLIRNNTLFCFVLVESTCVVIALTSFLTNFRTGDLTYKVWLPFNYSSSTLFPLVFTHQMISMAICALINLACDCFICGLLMHICCQIEILECRFNKSRTWTDLRDCSLQMIDRIFEVDWSESNNRFRKAYLMIMNRATIPIEFTSAYLFSMNLESFVSVLRLSYSAYTLLQRF